MQIQPTTTQPELGADTNTRSRLHTKCVNGNLYSIFASFQLSRSAFLIMPTKLTDDDWNSHQATIRYLYLTENRKLLGPGDVMQEMKMTYGLDAT